MTGDVKDFYIGIASKLQRIDKFIGHYDEYAIIYAPYLECVWKGKKKIQTGIIKLNPGEDIHFKFQPKLKKFSFSLVCLLLFFILNCLLS